MFKRFLRWLADDPSKFKIGGLLAVFLAFCPLIFAGCSLYIKSKHGEMSLEAEKKEFLDEMVRKS